MKNLFFSLILCLFSFSLVNGQGWSAQTNENLELNIPHNFELSNKDYILEVKSGEAFGWGRTAVIDAAGALGGAGSVAGIAGWFGWTPAAPVAAIAVGVGAIIGGAGASLAASNYTGDIPINPIDIIDNQLKTKENYFDKVGKLHNQIVYDYWQINNKYDPITFYDFIKKNKDKYGFEEIFIKKEFLENQYRKIKDLSNDSNLEDYIIENLPKQVNSKEYLSFIKKINSLSQSKQDRIDYLKRFEKSELSKKEYNDETKAILGGFFSTLKYSTFLWK